MMLNTIGKNIPDVTSGFQNKIKLFVFKGLHLYIGNNVETAVIENMIVCTRLYRKSLLPSFAVNNIIKGLPNYGHDGFAKVIEDRKTQRSISLLVLAKFTGTILKQIEQICDEAVEQYSSFHCQKNRTIQNIQQTMQTSTVMSNMTIAWVYITSRIVRFPRIISLLQGIE